MTSKIYSLYDLAEWKNGLAFRKFDFSDTGKPVIKIAELKNGITASTAFTNGEYGDAVKLQKGDMLFSWSGNPDTSIDVFWYSLPDGWLNQHIFKITPKSIVDRKYLYYLLKYLKPQFTAIASNKQTTGLGHVTVKDLKEIFIELPSFSIQESIGNYLATFDDKIEINQRINDNLQQQAQSLFKSWFVDFMPFGGKPPADWEYLNFSQFLTASNEKSNDPSLPMFSVTDKGIFPRDEKFKKNLSMTNSKSKMVHQTDLVFGMSREILNWGIMRHPIGGVSSAYNVFYVSNSINTFYLESYMKVYYQYFKDLIRPASREGQGIDKNALMKKVILIPPQKILEKYYCIEQKLVELARHVLEENQRLVEIRDAFLPKVMSGEFDVPII